MTSLLSTFFDWLKGGPPSQEMRAPQWSAVRDAWVREHPACAVCGTRKGLQVHHVVPISVDPSRELDRSNLMTLCEPHHLLFGHLCNWNSWNRAVREDAAIWHEKIAGRP